MRKPVITENKHRMFIGFNDYEHEEDFPAFQEFITGKLVLAPVSESQGPYSILAEYEYGESLITLMFDGYMGCCIVLEKGKPELAEEIMRLCYPGG